MIKIYTYIWKTIYFTYFDKYKRFYWVYLDTVYSIFVPNLTSPSATDKGLTSISSKSTFQWNIIRNKDKTAD